MLCKTCLVITCKQQSATYRCNTSLSGLRPPLASIHDRTNLRVCAMVTGACAEGGLTRERR